MIRKETIRQIVQMQHDHLITEKDLVIREIIESINPEWRRAVIISGVRRSGKSTLLKQMMQQLGNYHYISFEDIRLSGFGTDDLTKLDEVFNEENGKSEFYFFDEIQNIEGWEIFVRQKLDEGKHLVITGSNASLLSRELGTRLTGRHSDFEMFPFSYKEYLNYKKSEPGVNSFEGYLTEGGFPEYLKFYENDYLQDLLRNILIRDIAIRHNIRNTKVLNELAVYLLSNIGKPFSFQRLRKMFNFGSTSTIIDYISFMEDSYLIFTLKKFDYSLKKQSVNPKKIYTIDNGLASANSLSYTSDKGGLLENVVFIKLRSKYNGLYYYSQQNECDFVIRDKGEIIQAMQVCFEINADNKNREFEGLLEAIKFLNLAEGLLLTMDEEDTVEYKGYKIIIKPVWKWMLEF